MQTLHGHQVSRVRRRRKELSRCLPAIAQQKHGLALFAEVHVEFFFVALHLWHLEDLVYLGWHRSSQAIKGFSVDDVDSRAVLFAAPVDHVAVGGFDDDLAFLFSVSQHEAGLRVMAKNLQGGHERAFATVIGTDQYRQTIGRFDDRMPMRHEVDKFNPFNHRGPLLLRFEKIHCQSAN